MKKAQVIRVKAGTRRRRVPLSEKIPTLAELVAQITPKNRHGEIDWGPDQGKEKVFWRA